MYNKLKKTYKPKQRHLKRKSLKHKWMKWVGGEPEQDAVNAVAAAEDAKEDEVNVAAADPPVVNNTYNIQTQDMLNMLDAYQAKIDVLRDKIAEIQQNGKIIINVNDAMLQQSPNTAAVAKEMINNLLPFLAMFEVYPIKENV